MNLEGMELRAEPAPILKNLNKIGHLPHCLRTPAFVARLTLATLTGIGGATIGADLLGSTNITVLAASQSIENNDSVLITLSPPKSAILELIQDENIVGDSLDANWWGDLGKFLAISLPSAVSLGVVIDLINRKRKRNRTNTSSSKTNPAGGQNAAETPSELEELQAQLNNTTKDNIALRARNKVLEDQAKDSQGFKQAADGLAVKVSSMNQENGNLKVSNNALVELTKKLQDDLDRSNTAAQKVYQDNLLLTQQLYDERSTSNLSKTSADKATQENVLLKADKKTLNDIVKDLRSKNGSLTHEIASLKTNKSVLEEQVRLSKDEIDNLNKALANEKAKKAIGRPIYNPEWKVGQDDFEKKWQVKKIPLDESFNSVLERFKIMMDIIHEICLDNSTMDASGIGVRVRAGVEFVIPKVWTDKPCQEFFKRLYDKKFRAGFSNLPDDEEIAKIIYLPRQYRNIPKLSADQIKDTKKIYSILQFALHPDQERNYRKDRNWDLEDSITAFHNRLNPAWDEIKKIIGLKP